MVNLTLVISSTLLLLCSASIALFITPLAADAKGSGGPVPLLS